MTDFNKLPADVLFTIALKSNYEDIIHTCLSNKRFNQLVCKKDSFWRLKYQKDFGKPNPRDVYKLKSEEQAMQNIDPRILKFMNKFYNFEKLKYSAQKDLYQKLFKDINSKIEEDQEEYGSFEEDTGIVNIYADYEDILQTAVRVENYTAVDAVGTGDYFMDEMDGLYYDPIKDLFKYYIEDYNKKHKTKYKLMYET